MTKDVFTPDADVAPKVRSEFDRRRRLDAYVPAPYAPKINAGEFAAKFAEKADGLRVDPQPGLALDAQNNIN